MKNTGVEYEKFVRDVQQILVNIDSRETVEVTHNKILTDRFGNQRQFDIYWEFKYGGVLYKNVIECKDYATAISIDKIDAFVTKVASIPGLMGIFATKTGYQSGAETQAKVHGIGLLTIRKPEIGDWTLDDGTPLVREIIFNSKMMLPCKILEFIPKFLEEPKADFELSGWNNEIFIISDGDKYSLLELEGKLSKDSSEIIEDNISLANGFLEVNGKCIAIAGYYIKYQTVPNQVSTFSINSMDETLAYVQDHINQHRTLIKNDGKTVDLSKTSK